MYNIDWNLYLIEGRTTTNHINHEPPGFSVFFFQVAWYVEPHLKSCSTNVFVSSLWYLLRACFWRSCGLSSHEVDPLRGSSLDSPYPIDRYPPGDDHISPTQDPASTFWRCFSFSEDGRWMEMDSFLAGIDRTHPQPKRNMTKILYNPIRPVPGMMAFHFFRFSRRHKACKSCSATLYLRICPAFLPWKMVMVLPQSWAGGIVKFMNSKMFWWLGKHSPYVSIHLWIRPPSKKITSMESLMAFTSHYSYWLLLLGAVYSPQTKSYIATLKKNQNVFLLLGDCG